MASTFTKKHYLKIAKVIREELQIVKNASLDVDRESNDEEAIFGVVVSLSNMFSVDNPKFDFGNFVKACNPL